MKGKKIRTEDGGRTTPCRTVHCPRTTFPCPQFACLSFPCPQFPCQLLRVSASPREPRIEISETRRHEEHEAEQKSEVKGQATPGPLATDKSLAHHSPALNSPANFFASAPLREPHVFGHSSTRMKTRIEMNRRSQGSTTHQAHSLRAPVSPVRESQCNPFGVGGRVGDWYPGWRCADPGLRCSTASR